MAKKIDVPNLLEIVEESRRIPCEYFADSLLDTIDEHSQLPWGRLEKSRIPLAYRIQDVHLEQAMEAIYQTGQIALDELNQFRQNVLCENLEYLEGDYPIRREDFPSSDPEKAARNARLYRKSMQLYQGIDQQDIPEGLMLQDLEYAEILAERIAHRFPGVPLPAKYRREVLSSVVDIYARSVDEIPGMEKMSLEQRQEKVARARNEILILYPVRGDEFN